MKQNKEVIKSNFEFIERQRKNFSPSGGLLKELLNISLNRPIESVIFLLLFQISSNSLYGFLLKLFANTQYTVSLFLQPEFLISAVSFAIMVGLVIWLVIGSRGMYKNEPINKKKVVICLASKRKRGKLLNEMPAKTFIDVLLYEENNKARINNIQTIYIISTSDTEVLEGAKMIKKLYEISNEREVIIIQLQNNLSNSNVESLKKEMEESFKTILNMYKPYEIIADFTGGTKELSVSLYLLCQKYFILPAYLNILKNSATGQVQKEKKS